MFNDQHQSLNYIKEDLYKKLFELSPDAILLIEKKSKNILKVNETATKMYGFSAKELLNMKLSELSVEAEDKLDFTDNTDQMISNCLQKKKDGTLFKVDMKLIDLQTDDHQLSFVIIKDLTKQKDIENKLLNDRIRFSYIFENNPRPMCIYEIKSLRFLSVNDAAVQKYGYSKEEFQNITVLDLRPEEDRKLFFEKPEGFTIPSNFVYETRHKLKDNRIISVEINSQEIEFNGYNARLIEIIDITAQKKYEKELLISKEKAQEINRMKNIFFTNMSHELRTPLSGILGFSELLLEEIENKEHKNMVNAISLNGHRLLETLNKILHISKLESEKLNVKLEELNAVEFINKLLPSFEKSLVAKNLFLKFTSRDNKLFINVDAEFFTTIFENLISNAIKFTNNGGVLVNCYSESKDGSEFVVIEVSDTGIGISPNNIKLIFEEFRQVSEGLSRSYEGTGLGLTIAKRYTELLGGKISVESTPGAGSTFRLEFPKSTSTDLKKANQNLESTEYESESNLSGEKPLVLLVEDDFMNTDMIRRFLSEMCNLHTVTNGEEALNLVKANKYDAILMDIGLGQGINGIDTTKLIRIIPEYKDVPIIAITAYAMNGDKEKFLSSGMSGYISKPFKMNDLVNVLGKALKLI